MCWFFVCQGRVFGFGKEDELTSPSFADLKVASSDVFDFPLEPGEEPPVAAEPPSPRYAAQPS